MLKFQQIQVVSHGNYHGILHTITWKFHNRGYADVLYGINSIDGENFQDFVNPVTLFFICQPMTTFFCIKIGTMAPEFDAFVRTPPSFCIWVLPWLIWIFQQNRQGKTVYKRNFAYYSIWPSLIRFQRVCRLARLTVSNLSYEYRTQVLNVCVWRCVWVVGVVVCFSKLFLISFVLVRCIMKPALSQCLKCIGRSYFTCLL